MARPTIDLDWAETYAVDPTSGQGNRVAYPAAWQDDGWSYQEKPPRNYDNQHKWLTGQWVKYLDTALCRGATYVVAASDASVESKAHADAVCDGEDDHLEINAAITAVAATGGLVLLTEGTFMIESTITLSSNVHLRGMGRGATIIKVDTVITDFPIFAASSKNDVSISHLTIDGSGGTVNENHIGVEFNTCARMSLFELEIKDIAYDTSDGIGIEVNASSQILIERCQVSNTGGTGIHVLGASHTVHIVCCVVDNCDIYGIELDGTYNLVAGTSVRANTNTGIVLNGEYCRVSSTDVRDNTVHGIQIASNNNVVQGCVVAGNGQNGIDLAAADDNLVEGNMIYGNSQTTDDTYDGISVDSSSDTNMIRDNVVRHGGGAKQHKYGIDVAGSPNTSAFGGNDLRNSGKTSATNGSAKTVPEWTGSGAAANAQDDLTKANRVA